MITPLIYTENWIQISELDCEIKPYYYINDKGNIYSTYSNTIIYQQLSENGYLQVRLMTKNGSVCKKVHRILMMTFKNFNGCNNYQVNHINGNKLHNWIENLEWVTPQQNICHAIEHGLKSSIKGECNPMAKITNNQAKTIGNMLLNGCSDKEIAQDMNIQSISIIQDITKGKSWNHIFSTEELRKLKMTRKGYYFSDQNYHNICKFFQDHSYELPDKYGKVTILAKQSLESEHIDQTDRNIQKSKRLFYRYDRPDITALYNY